MTYTATLLISKKALAEINSYLSGEVPYIGEIKYRNVFDNGYKVDVKLHGTEKGCYVSVHLLSKTGNCVSVFEPCNTFTGTWEFVCGKHQYIIEVKENPENLVPVINDYITQKQLRDAEQCLIDNGIEDDEAMTVLQALGYILLDTELYPED